MADHLEAEAWPFDYDALPKGSTITPEMIEQMSGGKTRETEGRKWGFVLLDVRDRVELDLLDLGRPAVIVCQGDGLRVLTDEEAVIYNERADQAAYRAHGRSHRRNLYIDRNNLAPETQKKLDENILRQAFLMTVVDAGFKAIRRGDHRDLSNVDPKFLPKPKP